MMAMAFSCLPGDRAGLGVGWGWGGRCHQRSFGGGSSHSQAQAFGGAPGTHDGLLSQCGARALGLADYQKGIAEGEQQMGMSGNCGLASRIERYLLGLPLANLAACC